MIDIRFNELVPKVEDHGDGNYSIRYYKGEELKGILRCTLRETVGKMKPIKQRYVMYAPSETKSLMEYLVVGEINNDSTELSSYINKVVYESVCKLIL